MLSEGRPGIDNLYSLKDGMQISVSITKGGDIYHRKKFPI